MNKNGSRSARRPLLTVDTVIFREDGAFILVKRKNKPFKGRWAIPGGFVEYGERVEEAAMREAREETGLDVRIKDIVGVYSDPHRDPRGHVVSIAFVAHEVGGELRALTNASKVKAFRRIPKKMAFDHRKILEDAIKKRKTS